MGLWLMAEDKIEVVPAVDDKFIREFVEFSIISCPVEYCTEKFANPWFFDSENKLACVSGKFAEPEIWYRHLKMYLFDRWGYKVPDEISIIADYDKGFWELAEIRAAEYEEWKKRSEAIMDGNHGYDSLFSFTRLQRTLPPLPRGFVPKLCEQEDA